MGEQQANLAKYRQTVNASIRAVLLPQKNGLLFRQEYMHMCGEAIRYHRLGHGTLLDLLRSLPDVVTVHELDGGEILLKAVPSKNSAHLADLVRHQKQSNSGFNRETERVLRNQSHEVRREFQRGLARTRLVPPNLQRDIFALMKENREGLPIDAVASVYSQKWGRRLDYSSNGFESVRDLLQSMREIVDVRQIGREDFIVKPAELYVREWMEEDKRRMRHDQLYSPSPGTRGRPPVAVSQQQQLDPFARASGAAGDTEFSTILPAKLQDQLAGLVAKFPTGLSLYELPKQFRALYGCDFEYQSFGCTSLSEFCLLQPTIFRATKASLKSNWVVFPVEEGASSSNIPAQGRNSVPPSKVLQNGAEHKCPVPSEVQDGVKRTLSSHQGGVPLSHFVRAYTDVNSRPLDVTRYGFDCVETLLRSIDFVAVDQSGVKLLCPDPLELGSSSESLVAAASPEEAVHNEGDDPIPTQELPSDPMFEVLMGEVHDPGKFYVQLRGKRTSWELARMMDEMREFYSSAEGNRLRMRSPSMLVGQYCVVQHKGEWTRATVRSLKDFATVIVHYFDYGTVESVKIDNVRLLQRKFAVLPAQGILARCARVLPANGNKWSGEASRKFVALTAHPRGLIAVHKGTRIVTETFVSLELIDTNTNDEPTGININDELRIAGFAMIDPQAKLNDNYKGGGRDHHSSLDQAHQVQPFDRPLRVPVANGSPSSFLASSVWSEPPPQLRLLAPGATGGQPFHLYQRPPPPFRPPRQDVQKPSNFPRGRVTSHQSGMSTSSPASQGNHGQSPGILVIEEDRNLIQLVELGNGARIHAIHICDQLYTVSTEISLLFPMWKRRDLLAKMIALKKQSFEHLVILQSNGRVLFEQALCEAVPGFEDEKDELVESVTLYLLRDLPRMVQTLSTSPDESLLKAVEELLLQSNLFGRRESPASTTESINCSFETAGCWL